MPDRLLQHHRLVAAIICIPTLILIGQVVFNHYELQLLDRRCQDLEVQIATMESQHSIIVESVKDSFEHIVNKLDEIQLEIYAKPSDEVSEEADHVEAPAVVGKVMGADGPRSGKWRAIANHFLKSHPTCQWKGCKTPTDRINVHHIIPVHWAKLIGHPWLELCPDNLICLCHTHHIENGHVGNYKRLNIDIRSDAENGKSNSRGLSEWPGPEVMTEWLKAIFGQPSPEQPAVLPPGMLDPSLVPIPELPPMVHHCNDCERMMATLRFQTSKALAN